MDIKSEYLYALPSDERNFFKNLLEIARSGGKLQQFHEELVRLLVHYPYPTIQLLQLVQNNFKFFTTKACIEALKRLLADDSGKNDGFTLKFVNFIANFPPNVLEAESVREKLFKLFSTQTLDKNISFALLGRMDCTLLQNVLLQKQKHWQTLDYTLSKYFILFQTLHKKLHFVALLATGLKNFHLITDRTIRNNLLILKLANEFSNIPQMLTELGNVTKWVEEISIKDVPQDLQEIHKFFYSDFKRLCLLLEFLKKYPDAYMKIKMESLLNASSLIELLYAYNISPSYLESRRLIESIYKWQEQIPSMKCMRDEELETLTYYAVLSTVFEMIVARPNQNDDHYFNSKTQQLNTMLRQVRNIDTLCTLVEDIFQLVFLRWEHLGNEPPFISGLHKYHSKSFTSSSVYTSDDTTAETPTPSIFGPTSNVGVRRQGFVCRGRALFNLFSFLKNFVTKKIHSDDVKHAAESIQRRFQAIIDIIAEALWKYSVIEKIDDSLIRAGVNQQYLLQAEELLQMVQLHADRIEKSSSDDDNHDRGNYTSLTRRKITKKRRRASVGGAMVVQNVISKEKQTEECINPMTQSVSAAVTDHVAQLKAHNMVTNLTDRSIIPKMLGSPEDIAIMALALNNLNDVKYIIENFKLQNTELNRELEFVEHQLQVKEKLEAIYLNYQRQEQRNNNDSERTKATVEQIRHVAAKGFEVSKILNVIEHFMQTQKIQQSVELTQLIQKYSKNLHYAFLSQFTGSNLDVVIGVDLILTLPINKEVTSSIQMIIKRQQQINGDVVMQPNTQIGAASFLENLRLCMSLLKHKPLRDLLCDNYYSLKPTRLSAELQRQSAFFEVFNKGSYEISRYDDLKANAQVFQKFQAKCKYYTRFSSYVAQLTKLISLRDPNLEFHINELLKIDPCDVIGDLLFECNMTPLEIESNVAAVHLNLVHVIALNICPQISGKCKKQKLNRCLSITPQKQETILNYISNQNNLLAYLLQNISKTSIELETKGKEVQDFCEEFFQRLLQQPDVENLSKLYDGNKVIAALCHDNVDIALIEKLADKKEQLEFYLLQKGTQKYKALQASKVNSLVTELIKEDAKNIYFSTYMDDIALKAKLIQDNFTKLATTRLAKELIESTLKHKRASLDIPQELRIHLEDILTDITVYAKVSEVLQFETWPQAYDFGLKTPNKIFEKLLQMHLYNLCYKWCKVVRLSERFSRHKRAFFTTLLDALLEFRDEYAQQAEGNGYLIDILETFPIKDCVDFLDAHKDKFRSTVMLKYIIDFLMKNSADPEKYRNYRVSLLILEQLLPIERELFWTLLKYPLLIIEQLVMNAKFEILGRVLAIVQKHLQTDGRNNENSQLCGFCFDKRGSAYDIHAKPMNAAQKKPFQLGNDLTNSNHSAFILLNFNMYQSDHFITNDCIDLLLRIYATKALDYHISDSDSSTERNSMTTDMEQSLDSLYGAFQMPKVAPARSEWVRDEEASHCMCCRRAAFTMLMRRHHCRRCGRVVCFACSTYRMRIPELYADVDVRICNDCHSNIEESQQRETSAVSEKDTSRKSKRRYAYDAFKWILSGNITHDKLVREEFCYEHAPSVALCLSILGYHLGTQKCVDLLLYYCRQLEKLFVPNPEVDFELVAKMMTCLAIAAKVRGGPAEVEAIREHSEIIITVVQNGCESLIPSGPFKNHSLRKLADSLVQAEKWQLALDVHLKCGFPIAGVMAAHGLSCLRSGCFDTAREKFVHCMPRLASDAVNSKIQKYIFSEDLKSNENNESNSDLSREIDILYIKRPQRGPPLLREILKVLESFQWTKPQPETLQRASLIRSSNTSLASLLSRRKETYAVPLHEPPLGVLTTLANLKHIAKGQYPPGNMEHVDNRPTLRKTKMFEECMHYVLTYGSHADVLQILMRNEELQAALKYYLLQNLDAELFIHNIFLVSLRCGRTSALISELMQLDPLLYTWRNTILHTCRYLETQNLLNSLYQLQLLLKDPIRASMTCVKFYSKDCGNFQQLHANAQHLHNAHKHLQSELEISQWENLNMDVANKRKNSTTVRRLSTASASSSMNSNLVMQMDARSLNSHINTILKQIDVAKFLAKCEKENSAGDELITEKLMKQMRLGTSESSSLPTLFDSSQHRIQICILILYCGKNVEEGFGLAYRIIQDYKLPPLKIFAATAKYLARNQRLLEVEKLINCITSNNGISNRDIDEILCVAINSAINTHESEVKAVLDKLTAKIHAIDLRISCHIFIGQLKSAYLLANKHERLADIRKILRQAEATNQLHIKKLCEKKLNLRPLTQSQTQAQPQGQPQAQAQPQLQPQNEKL